MCHRTEKTCGSIVCVPGSNMGGWVPFISPTNRVRVGECVGSYNDTEILFIQASINQSTNQTNIQLSIRQSTSNGQEITIEGKKQQ